METRKCAICGKNITRYTTQFKSKNAFCSRKHKEKGMSLGLVAPMRLGTGYYDVNDLIIRRKYYKYRKFDKDRNLEQSDIGVRDFVKLIKQGECHYCKNNNILKLGLDRINNKLGHIQSNTLICCELCNMTRGDRFSVDEMEKLGNIIKTF